MLTLNFTSHPHNDWNCLGLLAGEKKILIGIISVELNTKCGVLITVGNDKTCPLCLPRNGMVARTTHNREVLRFDFQAECKYMACFL